MFFINKQVNKNKNIKKERSRIKLKVSKLGTDANPEKVNSKEVQTKKRVVVVKKLLKSQVPVINC